MPAGRRAWVQGGALWGDVDHETQAHGLATTGGIVSHTGVAGLTLGGGIGWLMRKHGLTIDNLLAVDVVTADGELLRASEDEHPDLFWALRGGGGNFGVVTSFEFRLHAIGPTVLAGPILWDATDAGEVLRFYRDFVRDAPDELGTVVRFGAAPPLPDIPEDLHWRPVVMIGSCYAGPIEDGEQMLRPLRASRTPLLDLVGPTPYVAFQSAIDSTVVHGWNYYWKSTHLPELRDDLIDVIAEHAFSARRRARTVALFHLKGAVSRVTEGGTAFGNRQASHAITLDGVWQPGGTRRPGHRLVEGVLRCPRPLPGRRLRQLPRQRRRSRPGPRGVRSFRLRPAGGRKDYVQSGQRLSTTTGTSARNGRDLVAGKCSSRRVDEPDASRIVEAHDRASLMTAGISTGRRVWQST